MKHSKSKIRGDAIQSDSIQNLKSTALNVQNTERVLWLVGEAFSFQNGLVFLQRCKTKNIGRVQNCPDIAILNFLLGLLIFYSF